MSKIRIYIVCAILFLARAIECLTVTLSEDSSQGYENVSCPENKTIILKSITYGESQCQDTSSSNICHSNIYTAFKSRCQDQNNCTLSIEMLSQEGCQNPFRRLIVEFKCKRNWYAFWLNKYAHKTPTDTGANTLPKVNCPSHYRIHIDNSVCYSDTNYCKSMHAGCPIIIPEYVKGLCDGKRVCLTGTREQSCFIGKRFASIHYICVGPKDLPVTDITPRLSSVGISVIVVSTLVFTIVTAIVIIVIVYHRKKRAKNLKRCLTHNNTTATERTNSSDYNIINLNQMPDIGIFSINNNTSETLATQHQQQDIKTATEQDRNKGNKYESISVNRNSEEHFYDSDSIHINQYESLKNPRESDKHTYESTEHALPQDINTSTEQEDNICNKYESLSSNRNSVEHVYESDSIHTNQYESLTKQREFDNHIYESTEQA